MTYADTTTTTATAEHTEHDAEALRTAYEFVWALRSTYPRTAAEYRERAAVLARLLNSAAMITQGAGASAYEYAAELITEAADSYTDTGDDATDTAGLDRVIHSTAYEALENAAHEALIHQAMRVRNEARANITRQVMKKRNEARANYAAS